MDTRKDKFKLRAVLKPPCPGATRRGVAPTPIRGWGHSWCGGLGAASPHSTRCTENTNTHLVCWRALVSLPPFHEPWFGFVDAPVEVLNSLPPGVVLWLWFVLLRLRSSCSTKWALKFCLYPCKCTMSWPLLIKMKWYTMFWAFPINNGKCRF